MHDLQQQAAGTHDKGINAVYFYLLRENLKKLSRGDSIFGERLSNRFISDMSLMYIWRTMPMPCSEKAVRADEGLPQLLPVL